MFCGNKIKKKKYQINKNKKLLIYCMYLDNIEIIYLLIKIRKNKYL